ncbi:Heat induced stress protein YflT [Alkalibacterium subtropicum]|uniref:Heat induced stress protein YflT n=1 Tax=Alkalibacterium subtropicum TaxID=753702 RepID=A0A1I1JW94_9LACT|nr:general stress protein [Alkalibacterium subtropicum]SFC52645.1 Heat induced stress protein YflT [Alkalibacterium subtropicum]
MVNANKTVVGSYPTQDEALDVVSKLKNEGYPKNDIILYSNEEQSNALTHYEAHDVVVDPDNTAETKKYKDEKDQSMWDKIKDAFVTDTYDHEKEHKRANYDQSNDILYPYRDDIAKGHFVVVVENYRGQPTERAADAGNTAAMPSDTGNVDDPGNTSAMPSDTGRTTDLNKDQTTENREFNRSEETRDRYKK